MTETFKGNSYEIVAWAHDQKPLLYHQFGSYQGEWVMLAKDAENYFVYKDWYGSCSGCDAYEAAFGYGEDITKEKAQEFAKDYRAFIEIPLSTMRNLLDRGTLEKVFPANVKDTYSDIDLPMFVSDAAIAAKLEEHMDFTVDDILTCQNQELKQKALAQFGYERFVQEAAMETLDIDGDNVLLKKGDIVFVYVKDSSTPRRYLLRVPPEMTGVKQAIAWTFNMPENEYSPIKET